MNFKKILLAVDASDNARRAVDYVGSIAGRGCDFEIQLLCIERLPHRDLYPDDESWKEACVATRDELKAFMVDSRQRLLDFGISPESVTQRYMTSCHSPFAEKEHVCSLGTGVAGEILAELKSGGFGTVVVGRRGVSKAEEFLFGSISNKIIHSAKDCTVWVVS